MREQILNSKSRSFAVATNDKGFALLLTLFVIALATLIVFQIGSSLRFDQRSSRAFHEGVQANYVLKSALQLGRILLEIPKLEGIHEDWLGEPWALIGSASSLPISGLIGEPRLVIVDDDGKIDLNSIVGRNSPSQATPPPTPAPGVPAGGTQDAPTFWRDALAELFRHFGFGRETFDLKLYRTIGNIAYEASDQVAVICDWIDKDTQSFNTAAFPGEGIESSTDKTWFFNRPIKTLHEALFIPGLTLERMAQIAPFVRVSPSFSTFSAEKRININTAPLELLTALGFPESRAVEIVQQRTNLPITTEILPTITQGDNQLSRYLKVTSSEFSIYTRVVMPNSTRWMHAIIGITNSGGNRKTVLRLVEFY